MLTNSSNKAGFILLGLPLRLGIIGGLSLATNSRIYHLNAQHSHALVFCTSSSEYNRPTLSGGWPSLKSSGSGPSGFPPSGPPPVQACPPRERCALFLLVCPTHVFGAGWGNNFSRKKSDGTRRADDVQAQTAGEGKQASVAVSGPSVSHHSGLRAIGLPVVYADPDIYRSCGVTQALL